MRGYVLVILKTGPQRVPAGPERDAMFAGHFANMKELSAQGKLALAGPFDGADGWRGLFVFAVGDIEEARRLVATDPVVAKGEMVAEFHKYYGTAALMLVPDLHEKLVREQSSATPQAKTAMTQLAKGTFTVELEPLAFEGQPEGTKLGRMSIDKIFSGDLVATTTGQMLSAGTQTKGSAGYVAIERVEGVLDGRKGSFVLQHTGSLNRGTPSLSVTVVPDSGTDELTGLTGELKIIIADGKHSYELRYVLARPE